MSNPFVPYGSREDAIRYACNKHGLQSDLAVIQQTAVDYLRTNAIQTRERRIKLEKANAAAYNDALKHATDEEVKAHFKHRAKCAKESVTRIKNEIAQIKLIAFRESWVSYQLTCKFRKCIQKELNRVSDCRTYKGQPARDMRQAGFMRMAG